MQSIYEITIDKIVAKGIYIYIYTNLKWICGLFEFVHNKQHSRVNFNIYTYKSTAVNLMNY